MRDPYLDVVYQHRSLIVMLYERYADRKPVMLFDIPEQRIYAMPYVEYRAELSKRSQAFLKKQLLNVKRGPEGTVVRQLDVAGPLPRRKSRRRLKGFCV